MLSLLGERISFSIKESSSNWNGYSSQPSMMNKTPLPCVLCKLETIWWVSKCDPLWKISASDCADWIRGSLSWMKMTKWNSWKSSPAPHLWQIKQAKALFPAPGAPSIRMNCRLPCWSILKMFSNWTSFISSVSLLKISCIRFMISVPYWILSWPISARLNTVHVGKGRKSGISKE